jgi:hypothetical protein
MEMILLPLVLVLVAGFINGSFATPMKYMLRWEEENVWFVFSFWGFLLLPWISIEFIAPETCRVLAGLSSELLWALLLGGLAFGLGQIAFALSFRYIGIGLGFVINISMGTAGSALIPLIWHKGIIGTPYSYAQILGIVIFISAVSLGAAAGAERDRLKKAPNQGAQEGKTKKIRPGKLLLGVLLAVIAGAGSVAQGVTYIWANPSVSKVAAGLNVSSLASNTIAWVVIFSAAWIPYVIYFFVLNIKNKSLSRIVSKGSGVYWLLTILMGVGFWGSLIFFSKASALIGGDLAPTIAWPLFMVFIILTSNFWSWKSGEWEGAGSVAAKRMIASLVLFVIAIVVFSYSSRLQPRNQETPEIRHHEVHYKFIKHNRYPTHDQK